MVPHGVVVHGVPWSHPGGLDADEYVRLNLSPRAGAAASLHKASDEIGKPASQALAMLLVVAYAIMGGFAGGGGDGGAGGGGGRKGVAGDRRSAEVRPRSDSSRFGRRIGEERPPAAPPPVRAASTAAAGQQVVAHHCQTFSGAAPSDAPLLVAAARRICISRRWYRPRRSRGRMAARLPRNCTDLPSRRPIPRRK
eukprot:scaffold28802_cov65-Phaeocystis_antarctica.AAC.3